MKRIYVDLKRQVLQAYENNKLVYEFNCASGAVGTPTTPGKYKVTKRIEKYRSEKYHSNMPYSLFYSDLLGEAIHASHFVGITSVIKYLGFNRFGSKGCVRLSLEDAKKLYFWTPVGTPVEISK